MKISRSTGYAILAVGYLAKNFKNGTKVDANNFFKNNDKILREAILHGNILASFTIEDFGFRKLKEIKLNDINKRIIEFKKTIEFY